MPVADELVDKLVDKLVDEMVDNLVADELVDRLAEPVATSYLVVDMKLGFLDQPMGYVVQPMGFLAQPMVDDWRQMVLVHQDSSSPVEFNERQRMSSGKQLGVFLNTATIKELKTTLKNLHTHTH